MRPVFELMLERYDVLPDVLEREFDLVTRLVARVPVRRLVFQKGFEHLSAVREAVLADATTPVAPGCLDA